MKLLFILGCIVTIVASARDAHAQCVPCDECPNGQSCVEEGELFTTAAWDISDGTAKPVNAQDPGANQGRDVLKTLNGVDIADDPKRSRQADPTQVRSNLPHDPVGEAAKAILITEATALGVSLLLRPPAVVRVTVPVAQGAPRPTSSDGSPVEHDPKGNLSDPIDPVTGEFIVRHTDLAFPSFGIAFTHTRVYRSRLSYDGPLGQGWDHGYNQRLVAASEDSGAATVTKPGCGPVLLLTTGQGTTLSFREIARVGTTIQYESTASRLTLVGHEGVAGTTWTLTSLEGDVRRFDDNGLLVSWVDINEVGLGLAWEPGSVVDWRLAEVVDSVGRTVEYSYDAADRLQRVSEASSGLEALYVYGPNGELQAATRGDGRSESYEYDIVGRTREDWVPEPFLHQGCELACSVSSTSCDAGGACDAAVADAMTACQASCGECAAQCHGACPGACDAACATCGSACRTACEAPEATADQFARCLDLYNELARERCESCDDICEQNRGECRNSICALLAYSEEGAEVDTCEASNWDNLRETAEFIGGVLLTVAASFYDGARCILSVLTLGLLECTDDDIQDAYEWMCEIEVSACCKDGEKCGAGSCNAGRSCVDGCRSTFMGYAFPTECVAPEVPSHCLLGSSSVFLAIPGTPEYEDLIACAGTASEWAEANGCIAQAAQQCEGSCRDACENGDPEVPGDLGCVGNCLPECGTYCDRECHVNDCAAYCESLDFEGQCTSTCADACVEAAHERSGGPRYGHSSDLDFNLVRIRDGAGNLWLENIYGQDVTSPDFDTVIEQHYGEFTAEMTHVDLRAEDEGTVPGDPGGRGGPGRHPRLLQLGRHLPVELSPGPA